MYVAEFSLHAKPGHYAEVAELYSTFAAEFLSEHDALESVLVVGDEGSGVVRGIGVFTDRPAADRVNSDSEFAAFNDAVRPLLATTPERVELELLHLFTKT
jgi:quinol monooxygenase YgiN